MSDKYVERVSRLGHPAFSLFPTVLGILLFLLYVWQYFEMKWYWGFDESADVGMLDFQDSVAFINPWLPLAVGLVLGLVTVATTSFILERTHMFHAKMLILCPAERRCWSVVWRGFMYSVLPYMVMSLIVAALIWTRRLNFSLLPASFIPLGLEYFERKKIFETAKMMLGEVRANQTGAPGIET